MTMKLPSLRPPRPRFRPMGLVVLLVVIVVVCWQRFFPAPMVQEIAGDTYESFVKHVATLAKVTTGKIDLPKTAHGIRFLWADCGLAGHATVCRFEGPLEDLKAYALAEAERRASAAKAPQLVKMTDPAQPPDLTKYGVREAPNWFDVNRIDEGLVLDRTDKRQPFTWIDTRRNVLYSYWTD